MRQLATYHSNDPNARLLLERSNRSSHCMEIFAISEKSEYVRYSRFPAFREDGNVSRFVSAAIEHTAVIDLNEVSRGEGH